MRRDPGFVAEAHALGEALARHRSLARLRAAPEWPELERRILRLLDHVRRYEAPAVSPGSAASRGEASPGPSDPSHLRAVHWNIEHGNWYEQVARALSSHRELAGADVYLFNEIDFGMARAGNRDVTGELAAALGLHGVWAPLFLETTLGRDDDVAMAGSHRNEESLFGLAILSRWPIGRVRVVDLPSPEAYQFDVERMVGRHIGLVAEIERPGQPFVAISVHLEVHRTRAHRARQMETLLQAVEGERRPVLLAGDFNTHTFDRGHAWTPLEGARVLLTWSEQSLRKRLLFPDRGRGPGHEPVFDVLAHHGFAWEPYVDRSPTLSLRLDRIDEAKVVPMAMLGVVRRILAWAERRGALRLDWFAGRGWSGGIGHTVPGLSGPGLASDHAPIVAEFW